MPSNVVIMMVGELTPDHKRVENQSGDQTRARAELVTELMIILPLLAEYIG